MFVVAAALISSALLNDPAEPATVADAPVTNAAGSTVPPAAAESWQQRQERLLKEYQAASQREAFRKQMNRPTAWQLQNPSGLQNRSPTEPARGYVAPNNYYGPNQRSWSNVSAPVSMSQVPSNYYTPTPAIFSNAPLAPNTYWGAANQSWSNVRTGTASPSALGGWNYAP